MLIFDGSEYPVIPLLNSVRAFDTREDYIAFMHSAFNFLQDPADPRESSLTMVEYDQMYSLSADLQVAIPVTDPIATLVGGRYGMVIVGGNEYCVDADRCEDPVDVFSLEPLEYASSQTFSPDGAGGGVVSSVNQGLVLASPSSNGEEQRFIVEGALRFRKTDPIQHGEEWPFYTVMTVSSAEVAQREGPFAVPSFMAVAAQQILCFEYFLPHSECYVVPSLALPAEQGENFLKVVLTALQAKWLEFQQCVDVEHSPFPGEAGKGNISLARITFVAERVVPDGYYNKSVLPQIVPTWVRGGYAAWRTASPVGLAPYAQGAMSLKTGLQAGCD